MSYLPDSLYLSEQDIAQQIEDYKYLHQHPELSHQESETTAYCEKWFNELQLASGTEHEVVRVGETSVVLVLKRGDGPVVGFRADTDGLPTAEESGLDYASHAKATLDGNEVDVMHGCGHRRSSYIFRCDGTSSRLYQVPESVPSAPEAESTRLGVYKPGSSPLTS